MKTIKIATLLLLLILCSRNINAQEHVDTLKIYQVETTDGNVYVGNILSRDEKMMVVRTDLGVLNIPFRNVKMVKEVKSAELVGGEVWPDNPHSSRYFYLPNGYGLRKGEGYYQNTWVFFNQVSYGFTNNFSLGFGIIPTFLLGANGAPVWITPKFSFPVKRDKWNIGAGAIIASYVGESNGNKPFIGMVYGVSTFGSRDKNFTVGTGFAFADNEWASTPVISLGGAIRTGKKHYFLTENYFFFGDGEMASLVWLGGRFASQSLSIDYGGIIPVFGGMNSIIVIPWLSITIPFGNRQQGYVSK
jgi:hypothetical protein